MSIPEDLVEEILCHVPAPNLKQLRTTCRRWNRLYNDWRFARKQLDKSPKQFFMFLSTTNFRICPMKIDMGVRLFSSIAVAHVQLAPLVDPNNNPASAFDISQVFHCEGLLLCTSKDESRIMVWNPLTRETRWIEPMKPLKKGRVFALGSCNNSKSSKILSSGLCTNNMEIYDFSSDSWRILDDGPRLSLSFSFQCVSLKGNAYMFATDVARTEISLSLLKFDFSTEKYETLPLSRHWHSHEATSLSVVRDEKIAVLLKHEPTSKTEIWVFDQVSWSNILVMDLSPDLHIWNDAGFVLDEEKKVLVYCTRLYQDDGNTFLDHIYIFEEDSESKVTQVNVFGPVTLATSGKNWPRLHNYVPSLVRINQATGYKRKRALDSISFKD